MGVKLANMERPVLNKDLDSSTFRSFYYLKEELVQFCRETGLPVSGGKIDLTERIANYLETGEFTCCRPVRRRKATKRGIISEDDAIESGIVCSERHRSFFIERIGSGFTFNVSFQKWLKDNAGKKYSDAVTAYYQILEEKKRNKSRIDSQFEYNAYIRDFFADNRGKSLEEAIRCWKYKKSLKGACKYSKSDLVALRNY